NGDLFRAQLASDRSHDDAVYTAGNYEIEVREIGRDVESEAMPGDPIASVNANRRDLLLACPHSGKRGVALTGDAVIRERVDQRLLDLSQVPMQVLAVTFKIDDGVADQLTGPMKGYISAALDLEQLNAFTLEKLRGCHE